MFQIDSWILPGYTNKNREPNKFNLKEIEDEYDSLIGKENKTQKDYNRIKTIINNIYYKERWQIEDELSQRLIVSFSLKYRNYQRNIRYKQIEQATKAIEKNKNFNSSKKTSSMHLIKTTTETKDGEVAKVKKHTIVVDKIMTE